MRRRILERWLYWQGFNYPEGVTSLLIDDARKGDLAAQLFIRQAEARHATEMFRDKILMPLQEILNSRELEIQRRLRDVRTKALSPETVPTTRKTR